jgi:2-polyprenyl-3-methyl-5-hydroxy-6-metoxy-1,4-benzoquinol methylase
MDQPGLNLAEHVQALQGLSRINALSRTNAIFWAPVFELAHSREPAVGPIRILDLATGGGDLPIALARYALQAGVNLVIEGCDISSDAVNYAQAKADQQGAHVRFFVLDALGGDFPADYDVVCCSLFLHHLAESDVIVLMSRLATVARRLVLIDDLVRSRWGYMLALIGCHLLSGSPVVHVDGPVSVAASFTPSEVLYLAEQAGLRGATLTRHWPQRFLLTWRAS